MNKFVSFILLLAFGWFSVSSLVRPGYFSMHDDSQALRVLQMRKCLDDRQIPCRWVPDMGYGYGYPQFNYYPPTPYYFMAGLTYLNISYLDAVKIGFVFSTLMAGIGMWLLGTSIWGTGGGLISGLFYVYLPYRANNMFVRGALGEVWAMACLPWIFYAFEMLLKKREWKYGLLLSFCLFVIATSHLLSVLMVMPFLMLWFLLRVYFVGKEKWFEKKDLKYLFLLLLIVGFDLFIHNTNIHYYLLPIIKNNRLIQGYYLSALSIIIWTIWVFVRIYIFDSNRLNYIFQLFVSGILGLGLSAFYILPVLFERKFVHFETLTMGYFNFLAHFVGIKQLLFSTYWNYGASNLGPIDGMSFSVGILHWTVPILSLVMGIRFWRKFGLQISAMIILIIFMWGYLFLIHPKSTFIWQRIEIIQVLQFPWRFLSIAGFLGSLAAGSIAFWAKEVDKRLIMLILIPLMLLNVAYFRPVKWLDINDSDHFAEWDRLRTISIFDYLPKSAEYPPVSAAPEEPYMITGRADIINFEKGSNWMKGEIKVVEDGELQLPLFDYPVMKMTMNGSPVEFFSNNELGLITLSLTEGVHDFEISLSNTFIRNLANVISLLSMVLVIVLSFKRARIKIPYIKTL